MKERYEQNVTVEKIMNCERSESETSQGTGPMPQHSTQEKGSEERDKNSAPSLTGSETIRYSQGIKSEYNLEAKASELLDKSKNYTNSVEKLEKSEKSDGRGEGCTQPQIFTSESTPKSDRELGSAVLSSEGIELSNVASYADRPTSSPASPKNRDDGDILEEAHVAEISKSLISGVDTVPLLDSPPEEGSTPVLNPSFEDTEKSESGIHECVCEAKTNDFSKENSSEGQITTDLESTSKTPSLSPARSVDDDVTVGGSVLRCDEPCSNKSDATPPSLSSILASASRTRQKRRSSSNSDHKQPISEERNSGEINDVMKLPSEPVKVDGGSKLLTQGVFENSITQTNNTSSKGVASDVQNLSDRLKQVTSRDSENDMPAGVEFLKTCFPDVDSDLMNSLFTANGGDVMKVVDDLLADLSSFPANASKVTEQQSLTGVVPSLSDSQILASQNSSSIKIPKSFKPADEMVSIVDTACGTNHQSPVSRESTKNHREMSPKVDRAANQLKDLSPKALSQPQSPSHSTFQLTLEPAVALHLIEMFGPFTGVNFQGLFVFFLVNYVTSV